MTIREARPEDARAIAEVHVASWRTTYAGIIPDDYLARLSVETRQRMWHDVLTRPDHPGCTYVAEEDGRIVGFASGGPNRGDDPGYTGELYGIYLLRERQGNGTGRALVRAVANRIANSGMTSMLVWVLAGNPSRGFYEALGGRYVREQPIEIGGQPYSEVAYGWPDTTSLRQGVQ